MSNYQVDPVDFFRDIRPYMGWLSDITGKNMATDEAYVMMVAIAIQESQMKFRVQINSNGSPLGPAMGLWQFEQKGGVTGVMFFKTTSDWAKEVCAYRGVLWDDREIHQRLAVDNQLAACFARLLLYTDPKNLPALDEPEDAWDYYLRNWRPGKPDKARWMNKSYPEAMDAVL
jgi:hypothetical protein